jgi:predicted HTH domain antitoxin
MQLIVNYPEKLPDALQQSPEQFEREAKMAMAAKLYELKRMSSGMAAALIGIERVEFLLELHRYGVAVIDLSSEELQADLDNA